jgi:competence protein ComEA
MASWYIAAGVLRAPPRQRKNVSVQSRAILALAIISALCLCAASSSQTQDRDRPTAHATSTHAPPPDARIDINYASVDQLMKAPGMTRTWAARIVRFRPYRTKVDLLDKGVVSGEVYARIKDFIIAHRDKE